MEEGRKGQQKGVTRGKQFVVRQIFRQFDILSRSLIRSFVGKLQEISRNVESIFYK